MAPRCRHPRSLPPGPGAQTRLLSRSRPVHAEHLRHRPRPRRPWAAASSAEAHAHTRTCAHVATSGVSRAHQPDVRLPRSCLRDDASLRAAAASDAGGLRVRAPPAPAPEEPPDVGFLTGWPPRRLSGLPREAAAGACSLPLFCPHSPAVGPGAAPRGEAERGQLPRARRQEDGAVRPQLPAGLQSHFCGESTRYCPALGAGGGCFLGGGEREQVT